MTTGTFVHAGIAAHFRGQNPHEVVGNLYHNMSDQYDVGSKEIEGLVMAYNRYSRLLDRYIKGWAGDYKATLIEPELLLDGVVCHPDLIAFYKEQRVIVDYKTSYHPDDRWYDISGQTDLYAHIVNGKLVNNYETVKLIIYDVISEEGIYRHIRPPRLPAGKRLFMAVQELNRLLEQSEGELLDLSQFLDNPFPDYTCPSRCNFFTPCWLRDTDSWEACKDYLTENFIKEER